jgi:uncharacterized membrane protein YtjA (UPF0391 family)
MAAICTIGALLRTVTKLADGAICARWVSLPASVLTAAHRCITHRKERPMLKYAIVFALISLVAGALGFTGVAAGAAGIAKVLFVLFLVLAVLFVVLAAIGVGAARKVLK